VKGSFQKVKEENRRSLGNPDSREKTATKTDGGKTTHYTTSFAAKSTF